MLFTVLLAKIFLDEDIPLQELLIFFYQTDNGMAAVLGGCNVKLFNVPQMGMFSAANYGTDEFHVAEIHPIHPGIIMIKLLIGLTTNGILVGVNVQWDALYTAGPKEFKLC